MKPLILFLCLLAFTACIDSKSDITSIEFATNVGFGPSQDMAIKIDSSLNYQFYGGMAIGMDTSHILKGYYSGKISRSLWDSLMAHLYEIGYRHLPKKLMGDEPDAQCLELIVHSGDGVKHVQAMGAGKNIKRIFDQIANSYKEAKLTAAKQPIRFETTYQQPDRYKASNSADEAKKLKTFLWAYDIGKQKIDGMDVVSIFAEKQHTINDFGVCDTISGAGQFVIVFKPTAVADSIFKLDRHSRWLLSAESAGKHYLFRKKTNCTFSCGVPFIDDPDVLQLAYAAPITSEQDFETYSFEAKNHKVPPPIKTKVVFYRPNTNKLKTLMINKDSL